MRDWYVGQKIVCINAQPIGGVVNRFIDEYLREGRIYKIRQIVEFNFKVADKREEKLAFRLQGIVPYLIQGAEYAFYSGRFRPLEEQRRSQEADISIFLDGLRKVNEGLICVTDEEVRELEPTV
jgi:hypothetical protein